MTCRQCFIFLITPYPQYGSEIWGIELAKLKKEGDNNNYFSKHLDGNPIAQLELKFFKRLLHVRRNTPTTAVRGELGRHPLTIKATTRSLKYLNQIKSRPQNKLIMQAYHESVKMTNEGQKTWYSKLKDLTHKLKLTLTSHITTKTYLKKFSRKTEKDLESKYETFWHQQLNLTTSKVKNRGGNKLRIYCKLKQNFSLEKYLVTVDNNIHRNAISQLRMSCHSLNIETLRGIVTNPQERVCKHCNLLKVEDEMHFFIDCPFYSTKRKILLDPLLKAPNASHFNSEDKFIWLLTNEDKNVCKTVGKFIHECFVYRNKSKGDPNL